MRMPRVEVSTDHDYIVFLFPCAGNLADDIRCIHVAFRYRSFQVQSCLDGNAVLQGFRHAVVLFRRCHQSRRRCLLTGFATSGSSGKIPCLREGSNAQIQCKGMNFIAWMTCFLLWQVAAGGPQFDVASLKPNNGCENTFRGGNLSPSPGRLEMPCVTLQSLIQTAFGTFGDGTSVNPQPLHTEGGPSWVKSEHYSLTAKADGPVRTEMLAGPFLQSLLEERFQLKTHRETREVPVYAMTVGKSGLKAKLLADGECTALDLTHPPSPPKPGEPRPNFCGAMTMGPSGKGDMFMELRGATMTQFAQRLSGRVDRSVVDKTGVGGLFNFRVEFTPDPHMAGQSMPPTPGDGATSSEPGTSLFVAIQEQIGVKLSSDKGPVSYLIIDHVEKPSAN